MQQFRYALIRFVKDRERMEPVNVGVILQGEGRVDFKLQPHFARHKDVDTAVWGAWRRFFEQEVRGEAVPLFQPDRVTEPFLWHLHSLATSNVVLSEPLLASAPDDRSFEAMLNVLYERLAAAPDEQPRATATRPTARFKEITEQRHFLRRGMKKPAFVHSGSERLWHAFRQVENGVHIAIDKVEVGRELHLTATEIQMLQLVTERLPRFLNPDIAQRSTRYILLADKLEKPFTDQSEEDFRGMKRLLDEYQERIAGAGGRVVRSADEVGGIATEMEKSLSPWISGGEDDDG
jgi:hypothetical protein